MNYNNELLAFELQSRKDMHALVLEQMQTESDFIMECLENMQIVVEAEVSNAQSKQNIFQKISAFLRKIFGMFSDKAKSLFSGNEEWMKKHFPKLDSLNYGGLEMEMIPFWSTDISSTLKTINIFKSKIEKIKDYEKYKDMKQLTDDHFREYLDEEGSLSGGLKNYFRTGEAKGPVKPVVLKGQELKKRATTDFRQYCLTYRSATVPAIEKAIAEVENIARMVESKIKKTGVKESYCLIEDAPYSQTDLVQCEGFNVLLEDAAKELEDKAKPEIKQEEKPKPNEKVSPTKVKLVDHGSEDNAKVQSNLDSMSSDQLLFTRNYMSIMQMFVTSSMSAAEEQFHAYLSATKQLLKKVDTKEKE